MFLCCVLHVTLKSCSVRLGLRTLLLTAQKYVIFGPNCANHWDVPGCYLYIPCAYFVRPR